MLAIARALARDIKLLLLDEPYEGLAPVIVEEIEKILGEIKALGITTIIVEQNAIAALAPRRPRRSSSIPAKWPSPAQPRPFLRTKTSAANTRDLRRDPLTASCKTCRNP